MKKRFKLTALVYAVRFNVKETDAVTFNLLLQKVQNTLHICWFYIKRSQETLRSSGISRENGTIKLRRSVRAHMYARMYAKQALWSTNESHIVRTVIFWELIKFCRHCLVTRVRMRKHNHCSFCWKNGENTRHACMSEKVKEILIDIPSNSFIFTFAVSILTYNIRIISTLSRKICLNF